MALIAKFTKGGSVLEFDCLEYHIFDKSANADDYFSMISFDITKCIDGETILEKNWGNGYQSIKIVDSIPNEIKGYNKHKISNGYGSTLGNSIGGI